MIKCIRCNVVFDPESTNNIKTRLCDKCAIDVEFIDFDEVVI